MVDLRNGEKPVIFHERTTSLNFFLKTSFPRTVSLSELSLTLQSKFSLSLIKDELSPSILLNLAHLAGCLDQHSIPDILNRAHPDSPRTKVSKTRTTHPLVP